MEKNREHLSLEEDEEDQIDLKDLVSIPQAPPSKEEYILMQGAGERFGFSDRSIKKKQRKRTPYVIQHNAKMRLGMKELLSDLTARIGAKSDQETLELGLLALIQKRGVGELEQRFKRLMDS